MRNEALNVTVLMEKIKKSKKKTQEITQTEKGVQEITKITSPN